ncbi:hypothetical protein Misp03_38840 [Microbispora sp. NBRC 16548]|nr:hypothetical protein Misp03_38840 [Microbispora sp. NBRC 16548]
MTAVMPASIRRSMCRRAGARARPCVRAGAAGCQPVVQEIGDGTSPAPLAVKPNDVDAPAARLPL